MERKKSAIVIVLDRLSAGYVGAYGNAWVTTPTLDRLASQSFLMEHPLVASDDLRVTYSHYWYGRDPGCDSSTTRMPWSLPHACAARAITTTLITDEPIVADHPAAEDFDEPLLIKTTDPIQAAQSISEIQFTGLLSEVAEWVRQSQPPYLLWIHARALAGAWDAPYALRQRLADMDDPEPPTSLVPPEATVGQSIDPDQLLGYAQSYAAQVEAIDTCLAPLMELTASPDSSDQPLLAFTSSRGYPLGQHGGVGGSSAKPYGELLHVPFMLRLPQSASASVRSQVLWQPSDLAATLSDWLELDAGPGTPWSYSSLPLAAGIETVTRDRAIAHTGSRGAIRTEHWMLVDSDREADGELEAPAGRGSFETGESLDEEGVNSRELYVKPDDRWEVSDVADRVEQVASALVRVGHETRARLAEHPAAIASSTAPQDVEMPPLPGEIQDS